MCALYLTLLLLLAGPLVVRAEEDSNTATMATACGAGAGAAPRVVDVQLARTGEQVQATLAMPLGPLPAVGCVVPIPFQVPEAYRPPWPLWRDVMARAMQADGTPDPNHPEPLPVRLWIHPDGTLQYDAAVDELGVEYLAYDLDLAWGTTRAGNDLAVLDILNAAMDLDLTPKELGAYRDDTGRVTVLDWHANHPYEYGEYGSIPGPKRGIHPPGVRMAWELPSELGQLTRLTRLALGGPLLTGTIPPELGQLAQLERLTLVGSHLTGAVPPELGQLAQLWELELHGNQLTALPPELGQLTQLATLSLAGNQLTSLPPELGQLTQLFHLGLAGNQLTALPPELGQLTSLHKLGLAGNQLASLPPVVRQLPNLAALDVQDNWLKALPSLAELTKLKYLDVSGNRLTALPALAELTKLKYLDVSGNRLTALLPDNLLPQGEQDFPWEVPGPRVFWPAFSN